MKIGFSRIQQEVWDTVHKMNASWAKGACWDNMLEHFHPDVTAIVPTERSLLEGRRGCFMGWKSFAKLGDRVSRWEEFDPVIHVHGNGAVVAYYFECTFEKSFESGREMLFLVYEEERWQVVGYHYSPYPEAN